MKIPDRLLPLLEQGLIQEVIRPLMSGKEAATPSRAWKLLSEARPEMILFLAVTARQQAVAQKIKNFFTK